MDRPLFRRRRYLIHVPFQLGIATIVFSSLLLYSLILGFLIFYPLQQEFVAAARIEEQARLSRIVLEFHRRLWPAVFVVALLAGAQAVFVSHRIAGPVFRVQKAIRALIAGDYRHRVRLRRRDWFREFEGLVNELAEELERSRGEAFQLRSTLRMKLETLEAALREDGRLSERAHRLLSEIRQDLERGEVQVEASS